MPNSVQGLFDFYYVYGNLLRRHQAALADSAAITAAVPEGDEGTEAAEAYFRFLNNFRETPVLADALPYGSDD